jgi:hypothetical protein
MGQVLSNTAETVGTAMGTAMRSHGGNRSLKISAKGIPDFNGNQDSWTKWKAQAENTFIAGGYSDILEDGDFSELEENWTDNEVVYTLLAAATIDGVARHVVAKFDKEKDGHMAWQALIALFDGEARLLTTSKRLREKLYATCLYAAGNSDRYLDAFLETYRDLRSHGSKMTEQEAIGLFLDNIHDPDYTGWKTAIKLHKLTLDQHVLQFRERADDINGSRTNRKRLRQHIRRLANGRRVNAIVDSDDETSRGPISPKRARRAKTTVRRTGLKEIKVTDKGLVSIPAKEWYDDLDDAERDYIQAYNSKVKHNEPTNALTVPANLKIVRRKPSGNVIPPPADDGEEKKEDDDSSESETEREQARPKTDRKKIRFNLNPHSKT